MASRPVEGCCLDLILRFVPPDLPSHDHGVIPFCLPSDINVCAGMEVISNSHLSC